MFELPPWTGKHIIIVKKDTYVEIPLGPLTEDPSLRNYNLVAVRGKYQSLDALSRKRWGVYGVKLTERPSSQDSRIILQIGELRDAPNSLRKSIRDNLKRIEDLPVWFIYEMFDPLVRVSYYNGDVNA